MWECDHFGQWSVRRGDWGHTWTEGRGTVLDEARIGLYLLWGPGGGDTWSQAIAEPKLTRTMVRKTSVSTSHLNSWECSVEQEALGWGRGGLVVCEDRHTGRCGGHHN